MYSGTNNGFLIRDSSENDDAEQQYNSREKGSDRPELVITFKPASLIHPRPGRPEKRLYTGPPRAASRGHSRAFNRGQASLTPRSPSP